MRRAAYLACGLALLIWLSLEDARSEPVVMLGAGVALLMCQRWLPAAKLPAPVSRLYPVLLGGLAGFASAITSAALMFFKNAWHAHLYWDFPPPMIRDTLLHAPWWALVGVLLGGALVCWRQLFLQGDIAAKQAP